MMKPPVNFLIDSFIYEENDGLSEWSEVQYKEPQVVYFCRIDRDATFNSSASGRQLIYKAVLFCYQDLTVPMLEFKTDSRITFDGQEHTIVRVIKNYEPFNNRLYSVEIEVV